MKEILLCLFISQLLLIPLARKWELQLKPVLIGTITVGIIAGSVMNVVADLLALGLLLTILVSSVLIIGIAATILLLRFYRDPERVSPEEQDIIVSPADGIIKYIKRIEPGNIPLSCKGKESATLNPAFIDMLPEQRGYLVGIAMNFLDVHVTRAPIKGQIAYLEHSQGSFLSLKRPEALYQNERFNHIIRNEKLSIGLIHIASRLVRRIVSYVGDGERLALGQRLGIIKFGSQVDMLLPDHEEMKITIGIGDRVTAGVTVIANMKSSHSSEPAQQNKERFQGSGSHLLRQAPVAPQWEEQ